MTMEKTKNLWAITQTFDERTKIGDERLNKTVIFIKKCDLPFLNTPQKINGGLSSLISQ